jgi:hypothetical protein
MTYSGTVSIMARVNIMAKTKTLYPTETASRVVKATRQRVSQSRPLNLQNRKEAGNARKMGKETKAPKSAAKPLSGAETTLSATKAKLAQIVVLATAEAEPAWRALVAFVVAEESGRSKCDPRTKSGQRGDKANLRGHTHGRGTEPRPRQSFGEREEKEFGGQTQAQPNGKTQTDGRPLATRGKLPHREHEQDRENCFEDRRQVLVGQPEQEGQPQGGATQHSKISSHGGHDTWYQSNRASSTYLGHGRIHRTAVRETAYNPGRASNMMRDRHLSDH